MPNLTPCHGPNSRMFNCACGEVYNWADMDCSRDSGINEIICEKSWSEEVTDSEGVETRWFHCNRRHVRGKGYAHASQYSGYAMTNKRRPPCEGTNG